VQTSKVVFVASERSQLALSRFARRRGLVALRQTFALCSQNCVGSWLGRGARRSGLLGHILTTLAYATISTAIIAVAGGSKTVVCYPKRYPGLPQWLVSFQRKAVKSLIF
jgi:hypothetical protein